MGGEWKVEGGEYMGEISALCFLNVPHAISSLPLLLAGSGSHLLLFDVNHSRHINSFCVFQGVRVHGIAIHQHSSLTFTLVISGERIVKLFSLRLQQYVQDTQLMLLHQLPRFSHWVLDFCFLEKSRYLAVGCNDNSLHIWDVFLSTFIFQIICPERCLLYSMKFWGYDFQHLLVASGTIFNEIVVWKLVSGHHTQASASGDQDPDGIKPLDCLHYEAEIISKLVGHQGSIFCLSWSTDGSKLVSVSDDRSARVWITDAEMKMSVKWTKSHGPLSVGPVLFGHGARIWDCSISDSFIVTAGEDCTCRVWGLDGRELRVIKEHIGRGIWRCLYDPNTSLLVTAGFDCAIKAHCIQSSLSALSGQSIKEDEERNEDVFRVCIPNSHTHSGPMDSKSEYVRCIKYGRMDMMYVATNHGYVYHAKLCESGTVKWTELTGSSEKVPVICMDLLSQVEDWIAVGDARGTMKIMKVIFEDGAPRVAFKISWSAEIERQLLGAYWCKSLGSGFVFTSNPRGLVRLWRLSDHVHLVADFTSPFGARIVCLDASFEEEVLVCGDLRGNLVLFPMIKGKVHDGSIADTEKITSLTYFKGAHGISIVSSISIFRLTSSLSEICSTGGDKCICYLEYNRDEHTLEFVGMRLAKELSLVQSVYSDHYSEDDTTKMSYAVGFSSTDFLIWNLYSETKVFQVKCGGWRRPHSYYLGSKPELCSSFAYVKDEIIYIHRYRVPDDGKMFPRNLHLQFHGREIHSLCLIPEDDLSWVATGCEDGTVRLTRYNNGTKLWGVSSLLGEHVGGSAVRSLCFVSKVHSVEATCGASAHLENPCLLISVGAKRVVTSWLLRKTSNTHGLENNCGTHKAMSFKWLSTDMPIKSVGHQKTKKNDEAAVSASLNQQEYALDNDLRYLAVTSFLVHVDKSRFTVCFVVVACSDATLMLRALVLPYRYWFDVASLAPLSSPILALQHAVTPVYQPYQGNLRTQNVYVVISGSTDGSISLWDITESVEAFMERVLLLHVEKGIDFQKRPRTGRGSQGGRWWKSKVTFENEIADKSQSPPEMILKEMTVIKPLYVLHNVHQSGVNCLHICCQNLESTWSYTLVSGGDDQALNLLQFIVGPSPENSSLDDIGKGDTTSKSGTLYWVSNRNCLIQFINQNKAISAHSSAVKGVWTDGTWIFSTGLDQRIRCWKIQGHANITQHGHFISSVPEPEALDVRPCGSNCYQVVLAGRGMQMLDISVSSPSSEKECH